LGVDSRSHFLLRSGWNQSAVRGACATPDRFAKQESSLPNFTFLFCGWQRLNRNSHYGCDADVATSPQSTRETSFMKVGKMAATETSRSKSLFFLGEDDHSAMMEREWSKDDLAKLADVRQAEATALGYIEYTIRCGPSRNWVAQAGVYIPGNSIIRFHSHVGSMQMGWNRYTDPTGKFIDNGERYRAESHLFTMHPDWNAFCFLVSTPTKAFINTGIPNYGASVGDLYTYWNIGAGDGGDCRTAFNDTDNNNSGQFLQVLRIESQRSFAMRHKNLKRSVKEGIHIGNG